MAKSADAIDNILLAIFGASFVVPTIIQSYGFDIRLVWIPTIFYASWILFTGYYKPARTFSDSLERSTIERIRGWSYLLMLPVTFALNFIAIYVLPRTLFYFLVSMIVTSSILLAVVALFPPRLFRKEIVCMEKAHEQQIMLMLRETGSAAILFSTAILFLNFQLLSNSFNEIILTLLASAFLLVYGYYRNRKSSKFAHEIAISLINSDWHEKYSSPKSSVT